MYKTVAVTLHCIMAAYLGCSSLKVRKATRRNGSEIPQDSEVYRERQNREHGYNIRI